jgi:putative ABC transport system substrate-binding protein
MGGHKILQCSSLLPYPWRAILGPGQRLNSIQNISGLPQRPAGHSMTGWHKVGRGRPISDMRRREFISLLGGASLAWPLAARAQQSPMPVMGLLSSRSAAVDIPYLTAFRQGLNEAGYVEGRNVVIEYRWAEGQYDQLPVLVADLLSRQVIVIITFGGITSVSAAKAATTTIPIVFVTGSDPVEARLVASLSRPGGNITGVTTFNAVLSAKELEVLHELVPKVTTIALLLNPRNPVAERQLGEVQEAARLIGLELVVVKASTAGEIDSVFETLVEKRVGALTIGADAFFGSRFDQFAALAERHRVPAIYASRLYVDAGGLISYAPNRIEPHRQAGAYAARILKGATPADLPVMQPTKFELIINLKTAKALGLEVPPTLLARADEVIE